MSRARAAATRCGVTRLADVTRLDVIGIPVFQAIRPLSRSLSVHQGKGETPMAASLGALMEAVECHFAEDYRGPLIRRPFCDLPPAERATTLGDFACDSADPLSQDEPLDWTPARTTPHGERFWLPFDVVSLDFSRAGDLRLDRSSDGLACRFDPEDALRVALLEAIERDAVAGFRAAPPWRQAIWRIDPPCSAMAWLDALCARLDALGIRMRLYEAPSVVALPTLVCELSEAAASSLPRAHVLGSACHPDPETALRKAVLEAVQSRVTAIAGARDDILPDDYAATGGAAGMALWPPPGVRRRAWEEVQAGCSRAPASSEGIAALLREAGYGTVAAVDLAPGDPDVSVVKVVVPGLGSARRRRRLTAPP